MAVPTTPRSRGTSAIRADRRGTVVGGNVSKVEMATPMALIYKVLFSSIATVAPPSNMG